MARPNFRKSRSNYPWHFCVNCPDWPVIDFDSRTTPGDPLCDHCEQIERESNCR
jgi:hypothetical protein